MKKKTPYLAVALLAVGLVVTLTLLAQVGSKSKPDYTKEAGVALTLDFNKLYAAQNVAIVNVVKCVAGDPKDGAPPNSFACVAQVGGVPAAQSCGAFVFTTDATHTKVVQRLQSQAVDPSNCN